MASRRASRHDSHFPGMDLDTPINFFSGLQENSTRSDLVFNSKEWPGIQLLAAEGVYQSLGDLNSFLIEISTQTDLINQGDL